MRIGLGYDVHAFADGRPLILGGVEIDHPRGLLGHSDADVVAHALADALLGAARCGDIGELFPDTDAAYQGADSIELLRQVADRVSGMGFAIVDADCVVVCECPKLAPHRQRMRGRLADAMSVPVENVGLRATTTEGLGFEGREEGIGAYAVVLLEQS